MTAVRYPIAPNAETALSAPLGRAARMSAAEAETLAGGGGGFRLSEAGAARPSPTREAALDRLCRAAG